MGEVLIEVEGESACLDEFLQKLSREAPPLPRIEQITCAACPGLADAVFISSERGWRSERNLYLA